MDQHVHFQRCPNGQLHLTQHLSPPEEAPCLSVDDLQVRLIALLTNAHASGVLVEEIVGILRDELVFEAELTAPTHRMVVQIIDLDPFELALRPQQTAREPERSHSRSLGQ